MSDHSTENHNNPQPEDHDSPWKEALEDFFQPFLQLLYPDIHDAIDWQQPITFLDKELQKPATAWTNYGPATTPLRCW